MHVNVLAGPVKGLSPVAGVYLVKLQHVKWPTNVLHIKTSPVSMLSGYLNAVGFPRPNLHFS